MNKADVLAKLEEYKGRPIQIGLSDEGAMLYSGIEGHWLFVQGDNLVEVRKNTFDSAYGFTLFLVRRVPFSVMVVSLRSSTTSALSSPMNLAISRRSSPVT